MANQLSMKRLLANRRVGELSITAKRRVGEPPHRRNAERRNAASANCLAAKRLSANGRVGELSSSRLPCSTTTGTLLLDSPSPDGS